MNIEDCRSGGAIVWFTGLSASGKTILCEAVARLLTARGLPTVVLDGDILRQTISRGLGFSREDRNENVRRIGALAVDHARAGAVVLVAAISPYREIRDRLRSESPVPFFEVFVDAPLQVCEERDPKGLYRQARAGAIAGFTGIDAPYEAPELPAVHCHTELETIGESCAKIIPLIERWLEGKPGASAPVGDTEG